MSVTMSSITDVVLRGVRLLAAFANPFANVGSLVTLVLAIFAKASGLLDALIVRMDTMISVMGNLAGGGADFRPLSFVNFVFPFSEFLGLLVGYLALLAVSVVIRIIKSFIPTIA